MPGRLAHRGPRQDPDGSAFPFVKVAGSAIWSSSKSSPTHTKVRNDLREARIPSEA